MMAWFRADDKLHSHPKARKAGLDAMGLWVLAGTYAMDYRTDGFVPDWFIKSWPNGPKLSTKLVRAGLWSTGQEDGESGYRFHDWHDFQPTLEELTSRDEIRRTQSQSGRLGAHRRWHRNQPVDGCPYCQELGNTQ